jgi:hypothetical protein
MNVNDEVIALLVDAPQNESDAESLENTGAHRLIREPSGRVCLEPVESQEEFDRIAKDTGCFRRGRAIRDPKTFEVIGYEMEEVSPNRLAVVG